MIVEVKAFICYRLICCRRDASVNLEDSLVKLCAVWVSEKQDCLLLVLFFLRRLFFSFLKSCLQLIEGQIDVQPLKYGLKALDLVSQWLRVIP